MNPWRAMNAWFAPPRLTWGYACFCLTLLAAAVMGWLLFQEEPGTLAAQAIAYGLFVVFTHWLITVWRARGEHDRTSWLFLHLFLIMVLYHLFHTRYHMHAPDIGGHAEYIRMLLMGVMPEPYGWQTQQPPSYYALAAAIYRLGEALGAGDPLQVARFLSLLFYLGFLLLSVSLLHRLVPPGLPRIFGVALILFWPEGFNVAVRISTDVPVLFFGMLCLYGMTVWHQERRSRWLALAGTGAMLAIASKGSAVLPAASLAIMLIYYFLRGELPWRSWKIRHLVVLTGIAIICVAVNFGRIAWYRYMHGAQINWFMNLNWENVAAGQRLEGLPYNYLYFDYRAFVRDPGMYSNQEVYPYYWNLFLKSLIFGESDWKNGLLMSSQSFLLICILAVCLTLAARGRWPDRRLLPAAVMLLCLVGGTIAAHVVLPWIPQANARYAFGMIAIIGLFYSSALEWHREKGREMMYYAGAAAGLLFVTNSLFLLPGLHRW